MKIGYGSELLEEMYVSQEMVEVFSATSQIQGWLDAESALARAEARVGLIPEGAAEEIAARAVAANIDVAKYKARLAETIHPIMPLVGLLAAVCEGDAGEYIHWGATTQDIMDTGLVLQMRAAHALVDRDLSALLEVLSELARRHRSTVMPGRTHGQHAVPITFGYKMAVFVDELRRHRAHLQRAADEMEVVQFAGAAGTLASLGPVGLDVRRGMAEELGLGVTPIAWHVSRDRLSSYCFRLTAIAGLCQRLANEVATLQRTELGELEEPFHMGKIGSSTMPHKRNPMMSEIVVSIGVLVSDTFASVLSSTLQQHERDMPAWQVEWDAIPRLCVLGHRAITLTTQVANGLTVDADRMRTNLDMTAGLINSEAVMMALAPHVGRQRAHEVVYAIAMQAAEQGERFDLLLEQAEELRDNEELLAEIKAALAPDSVIGAAELQVDRICGEVA